MKKKMILAILAVILIVVVSCTIYAYHGGVVREKQVIEYLEYKGYSEHDIQSIDAKYSFFSGVLGYKTWSVLVEFSDEPSIVYAYLVDKNTGVSQGSVSGGDVNTKKEELKHIE